MSRNPDYRFKITIVGDSGVGKTNLMSKYTGKQKSPNSDGALILSFTSHSIKVGNKAVTLQMWDVDGKEQLRQAVLAYVRQANIVFLVYDITNKDSFDHIKQWHESAKARAPNAVYVLIGNKADLVDKRAVDAEKGQKLAEELKCSFFEVSAKTKENVNNVFETPIKNIISSRQAAKAAQLAVLNQAITNIRKQYNLRRRVRAAACCFFNGGGFNPKREKTLDELKEKAQAITNDNNNAEKTKLLIGLLVHKKEEVETDHREVGKNRRIPVGKGRFINTESRLASCIGLVLKQYATTYNLEECKTAYLKSNYHHNFSPSPS